MNIGVILSLLFSYLFNWSWLDTLFAIIASTYLFFSSFHIIRTVSKILMDEELPSTIRKKIKDIVSLNQNVLGIRDLRTRNAGVTSFIQFSILLDQNISLTKAHELCTLLEKQVQHEISNCEVFIHAEPKE